MTGPGYSGRALAARLGIRPGERVVAIGAPAHYPELLDPLPQGVTNLADDGMLWISWPPTGSGVGTDLTENRIREIALPHGVVDVKACAVDAVWSGLKLVRRRELRR